MANVERDSWRIMEEDIYLIDKVKKYKDENSIKELIDRHSGIYVDMVNKYIPESNEGLNKEDVLQDKDFCIYDAAIKYRMSKFLWSNKQNRRKRKFK